MAHSLLNSSYREDQRLTIYFKERVMSFKRAVIYACTMATLLGTIGEVQGKIPNKRRPAPPEQTTNQNVRLTKILNRNYYGHSTLKVRKLLNIDQKYRGYELKRVILVANSFRGEGLASLMINHQITDEQYIGYQEERIKLYPYHHENIILDQVNSIKIKLHGDFHIKKLIAVLQPKYTRPSSSRQTLQQDIEYNYRGRTILPIRNLLNMSSLSSNSKIVSISLIAESYQGRGRAQLLIDGRTIATNRNIPNFMGMITFNIPSHLQDVIRSHRNLQLELQGNIYVQTIKATVITNDTNNHYPMPPRQELHAYPAYSLYGNEQVFLTSLVNADFNQQQRPVDRITLNISTPSFGKIRICTRGYYQTCTAEQAATNGNVTFLLNRNFLVRDIILQSTGNMTINSISVFL